MSNWAQELTERRIRLIEEAAAYGEAPDLAEMLELDEEESLLDSDFEDQDDEDW